MLFHRVLPCCVVTLLLLCCPARAPLLAAVEPDDQVRRCLETLHRPDGSLFLDLTGFGFRRAADGFQVRSSQGRWLRLDDAAATTARESLTKAAPLAAHFVRVDVSELCRTYGGKYRRECGDARGRLSRVLENLAPRCGAVLAPEALASVESSLRRTLSLLGVRHEELTSKPAAPAL